MSPFFSTFAPQMFRNLTYQSCTPATNAIRAVIASTHIVFIKNGEAIPYPAPRG